MATTGTMYGFHDQDGKLWRDHLDWSELTSNERKLLGVMIKQHEDEAMHTVGGTEVRVREISADDLNALAVWLLNMPGHPETGGLNAFSPTTSTDVKLELLKTYLSNGVAASWLSQSLEEVAGGLESYLLLAPYPARRWT